MDNKVVRLGIIGAGISARAHLNAFKSISGVKIGGIADKQHDRARLVAKQFGIPWCPVSAKEIIESPEIDALVIAVPPFAQPELAVLAFEKGKHVLCEKPLGVAIQEARRIIDAWKASRCVGMINFCYRLIPQIQEFKARLAGGECGQVHSIHAEWILSNRLNRSLTFHWKGQRELGGGVLQNFGIHVLDYLFYDLPHVKLLGAKKDVFISTRCDEAGHKHNSTGDEVITALFDIGAEAVAIIHLSLVTMPPIGHRVIARGSRGTLEVRNLTPHLPSGPFSLWFYKENAQNGECLSTGSEGSGQDIAALFCRVASRFIKAICYSDKSAEPSLESGFNASKLVDQIQRASGSRNKSLRMVSQHD